MSKHELIEAILQHNRTATTEFLDKFQESELKEYLDRVEQINQESAASTIQATPAAGACA